MNAQQILSGLSWSAGATVVSAICQFAFMAVLARLLDPVSFGLMAMATIVLRFASFFAQVGFSQALIQKPKVDAEDTTAALLMALVISSALYAAMALAAPLFAAAFQAPELAALIGVLGLSLVLSVMGSLPLALLRRQARFKRVNAIEVASFVLGYGVVHCLGLYLSEVPAQVAIAARGFHALVGVRLQVLVDRIS
jgi:lipopolysaccharide exporter